MIFKVNVKDHQKQVEVLQKILHIWYGNPWCNTFLRSQKAAKSQMLSAVFISKMFCKPSNCFLVKYEINFVLLVPNSVRVFIVTEIE